MPVHVKKQGSKYLIVETATGKTVGTSDTRKKAEISASKRNAAHKGKKGK